MYNVLVTGANGFIAQALCRKMVARGWQVRGTIRASNSQYNLPAKVDVISLGKIDPYTDWSKAVVDIDVVVHLAARVHIMNDPATDPLAAFRRVNVKGTERLAQQAVAANVKRFFFMSSIKVKWYRN